MLRNVLVIVLSLSFVVSPTVVGTSEVDLNPYVLQGIADYTDPIPYLLNTDYANYNGVTEDIVYGSRTLLKAHPSGNKASHCVGLTFEVFFNAMQLRNKELGLRSNSFNGMTGDELFDFILTWYAAKDDKGQYNLATAVESYGLGRRITDWNEIKPGDFIDFTRANHTGHAVVFLDWVYHNGQIVGMRYWSTQDLTSGVGVAVEYFDATLANAERRSPIKADSLFVARVGAVSDYRGFRHTKASAVPLIGAETRIPDLH